MFYVHTEKNIKECGGISYTSPEENKKSTYINSLFNKILFESLILYIIKSCKSLSIM